MTHQTQSFEAHWIYQAGDGHGCYRCYGFWKRQEEGNKFNRARIKVIAKTASFCLRAPDIKGEVENGPPLD